MDFTNVKIIHDEVVDFTYLNNPTRIVRLINYKNTRTGKICNAMLLDNVRLSSNYGLLGLLNKIFKVRYYKVYKHSYSGRMIMEGVEQVITLPRLLDDKGFTLAAKNNIEDLNDFSTRLKQLASLVDNAIDDDLKEKDISANMRYNQEIGKFMDVFKRVMHDNYNRSTDKLKHLDSLPNTIGGVIEESLGKRIITEEVNVTIPDKYKTKMLELINNYMVDNNVGVEALEIIGSCPDVYRRK